MTTRLETLTVMRAMLDRQRQRIDAEIAAERARMRRLYSIEYDAEGRERARFYIESGDASASLRHSEKSVKRISEKEES